MKENSPMYARIKAEITSRLALWFEDNLKDVAIELQSREQEALEHPEDEWYQERLLNMQLNREALEDLFRSVFK